jgi:Putative lipoprotein GNA1162-like
MTRLPTTKRGSSRCQLCVFFIPLALLVGCASTQHQQPQSRPFFLTEEELETHGRKTWFDRLIEADPGGVSFVIAGDYQERPPRKIAVLPFVDKGTGSYLLNKVPVKTRDEEERSRWSWTHTNRVRRAVAGELATREYIIVPLLTVDAVLASHSITDGDTLKAVPPEDLGRWLDADTVVYGELLSYEAYYGFLVSAWKVSAGVRMVSTKDGHEIFSCTNLRYSSTVTPVIDPIDIGINSVLSLLDLRDISLARTEYEVGREIALRLPRAQQNIAEFLAVTKEETRGLDSSGSQASASKDSVR